MDILDKAHEFFEHHFTASEKQESREEIESQDELQVEKKSFGARRKSEGRKWPGRMRRCNNKSTKRDKNNYI